MANSKSDTAARAAETVKAKAAETTETVKAEAAKRAEGAKSSLASEVSTIASALKAASREFSDGSTESNAFNQVAEGLSGASDAIKQKSLSEMVSDLNSFARRNPAVFLGGATLLGFAASRFGKATAESTPTKSPAETTADARFQSATSGRSSEEAKP